MRNDVAHGFVLRPPAGETAALALRALAVLTLLVAADSTVERPADNGSLAQLPGTMVDAAAFFLRIAARHPAGYRSFSPPKPTAWAGPPRPSCRDWSAGGRHQEVGATG